MDTSGNVTTPDTLAVAGNTTLHGSLTQSVCEATKFSNSDTSGNVTAIGALSVTASTTMSNALPLTYPATMPTAMPMRGEDSSGLTLKEYSSTNATFGFDKIHVFA